MTLMTVRVAHKRFETAQICRFELVPAGDAPLPGFSAGAHIDVHMPNGPTRQYSLCNDPAERGRYVIGVLRDPASRGGSVALVDGVDAGHTLRIGAPRNHFALDETARHSVLMGGGIGITPLLCMAERLAANGASFALHYAVRSRAAAAFLDRIAQARWAGQAHLHCDDGPQAQRLDLAAVLARPSAGTHLYVCGPSGYMDAVLGAARGAAWPQDHLHCEYFKPVEAPTEAPAGANRSFELQLSRSGRVLAVPAGRSAAEVLIAAGVDLEVSCEQGVCGACLTRVIDGVPEHRDMLLTPAERAANDQFTPCCSRALSSRLVVDL